DEISQGLDACPSCGFSLVVRCPFCAAPAASSARFCAECGQPLGDAAVSEAPAAVVASERRQLTVLFFDFVGSTTLASSVDPEGLREAMAEFQRCTTEVVLRRGGYMDHFRGDGAPVYFGYPVAHAHDAERAIRAGLEMVEAVSKLTLLGDYRPQVRIAIAT